MKIRFRSLLIVADIEGSSDCPCRDAMRLYKPAWARACLAMTRDVNAVATALLDAGAERITVKDFHRTGYNLLPELMARRVRIVQGYRKGPVPGIGDPGDAEAVLFLGMHAASGSATGFMPHTLTTSIRRLAVNGRLMTEVELFASSLAPFGVRPVFFSGCPTACAQAAAVIPGIGTFPVKKPAFGDEVERRTWRKAVAWSVVQRLSRDDFPPPFLPAGPFEAVLRWGEGRRAAGKIARRWGFTVRGDTILIRAETIHKLYYALIRLCYLNPAIEAMLPVCLPLYDLHGRAALQWARRQLRREGMLRLASTESSEDME